MCLLEFSRFNNGNRVLGLARVGALFFNALDNVFTFQDLAKHSVASIQPRSLDGSDKELGTVGVGLYYRGGASEKTTADEYNDTAIDTKHLSPISAFNLHQR